MQFKASFMINSETRGRSLDENVKFNEYIKMKRSQLALHAKELLLTRDPRNIYNLAESQILNF